MGEYHFKLPDIGEGVVEAEITAWHVSLGARVSEDDPIADAMTDKATIELTSPVDGIITRLACAAGDMLAVGADVAIFEIKGEPVIETAPPKSAPPEITPKTPPQITPKTPPQITSQDGSPKTAKPLGGKVLASPAVRKHAKENGLDLAQIPSSGLSGEITRADLKAYEAASRLEAGETRIKIIGLRRVIAQRMQAAKQNIPHLPMPKK